MIKQCGMSYYTHITNTEELKYMLIPKDRNYFIDFLNKIAITGYDVIKIDTSNRNISLIKCIDWDNALEPCISSIDVYSYRGLKHNRHMEYKDNCPIYHNKWMFVSDDYKGFDISEAKNRTCMLQELIPDYESHKRKIGFYNYWSDLLKKYNIPL